jgi:hypothetical protein
MPVMLQNRFEDTSKYRYLTFLISTQQRLFSGGNARYWSFDASQLVLERLESAMTHDRNLNPRCKDRKLQHEEQAGINFDAWKNTVIILENRAHLIRN